jgi:acyl carrier protein
MMSWFRAEKATVKGMGLVLSRNELIERVLEIIRSECNDQTLTMDTPTQGLNMDSVDVINILFCLEDEFKVSVDLDLQAMPVTVGEMVEALIKFIPHSEASPSDASK